MFGFILYAGRGGVSDGAVLRKSTSKSESVKLLRTYHSFLTICNAEVVVHDDDDDDDDDEFAISMLTTSFKGENKYVLFI